MNKPEPSTDAQTSIDSFDWNQFIEPLRDMSSGDIDDLVFGFHQEYDKLMKRESSREMAAAILVNFKGILHILLSLSHNRAQQQYDNVTNEYEGSKTSIRSWGMYRDESDTNMQICTLEEKPLYIAAVQKLTKATEESAVD